LILALSRIVQSIVALAFTFSATSIAIILNLSSPKNFKPAFETIKNIFNIIFSKVL